VKTTAFGVSCLAIVMTTLIALLQIVTINTRAASLQDNLQDAMESSLATAMDERSYTIADSDQLVADVVEGIALTLNDPHAELTVEVTEADQTLGILSLTATARYPSVASGDPADAGTGSTVTATRTVILERADTRTPGSHTIRFLTPAASSDPFANATELYKEYTLTEGAPFPPYPAYTDRAGKQCLVGWMDTGGQGRLYRAANPSDRSDFKSLTVDGDHEFVAVLGGC
jgi:hypothetical protein